MTCGLRKPMGGISVRRQVGRISPAFRNLKVNPTWLEMRYEYVYIAPKNTRSVGVVIIPYLLSMWRGGGFSCGAS